MMTYKVEWAENKNDGWKVCSIKEIVEGGRTYEDVSINRTDKKGRTFPNFDGIAPGATISGNIWQSVAGKYTLFAPDPAGSTGGGGTPARSTSGPASGGGAPRGVAAAQERKKEGIREAQENKGRGVMVASAFRDATLIMTSLTMYQELTPGEWQIEHEKWRQWYMADWKETEKSLDVPF